ncbi:NERD domain-containing protein [Nocardioides sp. 1609]|uniref:NERD domain-containing protein n=1 Tax=Nocardioides sp. 1609 TaxID=2508327 RepID=UPI00106F9F62|nr:NERD domain-containing protein [Nocardioides sp. 1609]
MAGEPAEAVATRQRQKAARPERPAGGRGAEGDRVTEAALGGLGPEWSAHHDLTWPGRTGAHRVHVVVGPPGVFVVEPQAWSGRVTTAGGVLRQNGLRRDDSVAAVKDAARAVGEVTGTAAIPLLCLSGAVTGRILDGVVVTSAADVVRTLSTFGPSLDDTRREDARRRLEEAVAAGSPVRRPQVTAPPDPAPLAPPAPLVPLSPLPPLPPVPPVPRVRSAALVPAARLRRSSLPVGSSSSTRGATRRILPRVLGGVLAVAMFGILVVPGPRDWVSDRIYDMVAPDLPPAPDPVERPARQGTKASNATTSRQQARQAARRAGRTDGGVAP